MNNFIFFNSKIIPKNKVYININDRGLLYGDGFFETLRSFKDEFLDLPFHIKRLKETAKFFGINLLDFPEKIENILFELKEKNRLISQDCYVRITITRGVDPFGPSIKKDLTPTIIIELKKLPKYIIDRSEKGVKVTLLQTFKKEKNIIYNYKTLNYLPTIIGFLNRKIFDDVIFLDKYNYLIEGITANLFFYKGKTLYTSNENDLFLKGVTREILIKAIKKFSEEKFNIRYRNFKFNDLKNIEGAFFTNSLSIIYPIISIEDFELKHRDNIINRLKKMYFNYLKSIKSSC